MKGDVVVVPFPYSDLSKTKSRPALVLIELSGEDVVLAAITATNSGRYSIPLQITDIKNGSLDRRSFVRIASLFTLCKSSIVRYVGTLTEGKRIEIVEAIHSLMQ